jgi:DNA-binding NtrC family response regulator
MTDLSSSVLLGNSPAINQLRRLIERIAVAPISVLIQGPTGAGKEVVARTIHRASGRPGPFIPFNVSGIAESMFEDTLFGHVRGAFTGALHSSSGYLREADGGTLFMDEVGQLRLTNQSTLLRAVETRTFRPIGGDRDYTSAFRLVSATNEDVSAFVERGIFRADLFHRIGTCVLTIPPLRAHPEDIPILAKHFLSQVIDRGQTVTITPSALHRLQAYDWPGNVRQLQATIHVARYLMEGTLLDCSVIEESLRMKSSVSESEDELPQALPSRLDLLNCLTQQANDIDAVARSYRVSKGTVYRWLRTFDIPTPQRRRPVRSDSSRSMESVMMSWGPDALKHRR